MQRQIKLQSTYKTQKYGQLGLGTSNQLFIRGYQTETKFSKKKKQLLANFGLLLQILFALILTSDMADDAFSVFVLSTKKSYPSFFGIVFFFQKICFKVKAMKMFKIFTDCHIKTSQSLQWRTILKIHSTVFRSLALSGSFKMKPLRKIAFQC